MKRSVDYYFTEFVNKKNVTFNKYNVETWPIKFGKYEVREHDNYILCILSAYTIYYHVTTVGKRAWALDTLFRPGNRLMKTFTAFQTVSCLIWAIVMRRASRAKHLPNPETWRTRDILFNFHSTVIRLQIRVNQWQFWLYWIINVRMLLL